MNNETGQEKEDEDEDIRDELDEAVSELLDISMQKSNEDGVAGVIHSDDEAKERDFVEPIFV